MTHDWLTHIKNSPVAHLNEHLITWEKTEKKSKYKNQRLELDGHKFDSKREARRYVVLRGLQTLGLIKNLQLQVPFELNTGGTHSLVYRADFVYEENGRQIVEDSKGALTKVYLKKKRLMKQVHNIEIKET